jgi:hypothetical protein
MSKIVQSVEAHYETLEVPLGRIYLWEQARVTLECDCGEILTFSGTSTIVTCRCGAAYGALVRDIHYREEHLGDEDGHPWHYDLQSQANQTYETKLLILRALPGDPSAGLMCGPGGPERSGCVPLVLFARFPTRKPKQQTHLLIFLRMFATA